MKEKIKRFVSTFPGQMVILGILWAIFLFFLFSITIKEVGGC